MLLGGPVVSSMATGRGLSRVHAAPLWHVQGSAQEAWRFKELVQHSAATAIIALGYPEQFPFLDEERDIPPFLLWAQFSRVPKKPLAASPLYVPLTATTKAFLHQAGCSRIGPIIPHGVDTQRFTPERRRTNSFRVGTVGNNSRRKRFDLILHAFALLARKRPDAQLVIKTNRLVSLDGVDLPDLIARENLQDRVETIVEELSEQQLVELYNRMDVYLTLSEWEGFCIPVIEAMACGVPVVSLPIQGPGELLPYTETLVPESLVWEEDGTRLFEARPPAVCQVLLDLAAGGEALRQRLRQAGRQHSESRYDLRQVVDLWEALL